MYLAISVVFIFVCLIFYSLPPHEPFAFAIALHFIVSDAFSYLQGFLQFPDGCYVVEHHRGAV